MNRHSCKNLGLLAAVLFVGLLAAPGVCLANHGHNHYSNHSNYGNHGNHSYHGNYSYHNYNSYHSSWWYQPGSSYYYYYSYETAPAPQPADVDPPPPPPPAVYLSPNGHHYMRASNGNYYYID